MGKSIRIIGTIERDQVRKVYECSNYKQSPTQMNGFQFWFDTKMILLEYRERDNRATVLSRNNDDFLCDFNIFHPHSMVAR